MGLNVLEAAEEVVMLGESCTVQELRELEQELKELEQELSAEELLELEDQLECDLSTSELISEINLLAEEMSA